MDEKDEKKPTKIQKEDVVDIERSLTDVHCKVRVSSKTEGLDKVRDTAKKLFDEAWNERDKQ